MDLQDELKKVGQSKKLIGIIYGIGIVVIAMLIFGAGVSVGFHQAQFAHTYGDNYSRIFGDERGGIMSDMHGGFTNAHGTVGKVVKIDLPTIVVAGGDGVEKSIIVDDDTIVKLFHNDIKITDLKIGDSVVIVGIPDDQGQIKATFMRVMPLPAPATTTVPPASGSITNNNPVAPSAAK